jgi:RNA polymerase sigma-70 factor (ECF subfamily)
MVATLTRFLGPQHLELAEDAVQETLVKALRQWPYRGVPDNPPAWLMTVARNQALDLVRRERQLLRRRDEIAREAELAARQDELEQAADLLDSDTGLHDDQLRLMFVCCHPALSRPSQVALTLRTLCGFGVAEIARAFLAQEPAIAQRLVRAKRTIRERNLPFAVPEAADLPARLDAVLDVLYLLFNEGYSAHQGEALVRQELCAEAIRLCWLLLEHQAGDVPKARALLALMLFQASRLATRTDPGGDPLLLDEQDRSRWDRGLIRAGLAELARSARGDELTVYHLQAGIAACHAVAPDYAATDWREILAGYDALLRLNPTPVVALNRAVALAMVAGPPAGLAELERIGTLHGMAAYHLFHSTNGELRRRAGDLPGALAGFRRARACAATEPERRLLDRRIAECELALSS